MDPLQLLAEHDLLPPRFLKVAITGRCNLHCRHCWPDSGPHGGEPVALPRILTLLEEFVALGGTGVSITGGEPLTHPGWRQIVGAACALDSLDPIELQTNATLLDGAARGFLADLPANRFTLRISLDGARELTNDKVRGAGTFDRVVHVLAGLSERGLTGRVVLAMTETEDNYAEIPELLELGERYGVRKVETATLLPRGRAAQGDAPRGPRPDQVAALVERYDRDAALHRRYDQLGCTSAVEWARWFPQPREHYCTFVENPFVDVHGRFFPCAMYEREEAAVEGVFSRPLADTLRAGAETWGRLRRASRKRIAEPGPCAGCPGWCHCRGGCFGRSTATDGNTSSQEDRCALRRAVYAARG